MTLFQRTVPIFALAGILIFASPAAGHGPTEQKEDTHMGGAHRQMEEAMKAQHERMANFHEAAEMLLSAIVYSALKPALEAAEKLERSMAGHESDMPHKNREQAKEFQGLYSAMGKRTANLKAAIQANDLPESAAAYGRVLQTCATCHRKFRD